MTGDRLHNERAVVNNGKCFVAATMRSGYSHQLALILHCPATSAFLGIHLHVQNHASHCWSQMRYQQEDHNAELVQSLHATTFRIVDPAIAENGQFRVGVFELARYCVPFDYEKLAQISGLMLRLPTKIPTFPENPYFAWP
jgi:hypothetical protein